MEKLAGEPEMEKPDLEVDCTISGGVSDTVKQRTVSSESGGNDVKYLSKLSKCLTALKLLINSDLSDLVDKEKDAIIDTRDNGGLESGSIKHSSLPSQVWHHAFTSE